MLEEAGQEHGLPHAPSSRGADLAAFEEGLLNFSCGRKSKHERESSSGAKTS
jgi:hypothetical protein